MAEMDDNSLLDEWSYDIEPMVAYLKLKFGYLEISNPTLNKPSAPKLISGDKNGWRIIDFGNRLITSAGLAAYGTHEAEAKLPPGTLVNQGWLTAYKLINLAKKRGWHEIAISKEPGTSRQLAFAVWNAAEDNSITNNYDTLPEDKFARDKINAMRKQRGETGPGYGG